jgi:hypothetical protein
MNMKRMRGRNHRPNGGGGGGGGGFRNQQNGIPLNRNHVFDSSGPEMRVRGTAQQLYEKYQQLARDASSSGDRVTGEAYYQHAEHYFRIINAINQAQGQPNGQQGGQPQGGQPYQQNGQDRGNYQNNGNGQGDYNRRQEPNQGDVSTEPQAEPRAQEPRFQEPRFQEPRFQEPRQEQPRRFEQRPYEPRNKPEFQRNDRPERTERFRAETPVPDPRIDISSALEAELAATVAEPPDFAELPGFGEQPVISEPAPEARAIPIIPDAPPAVVARVPRPRGRPRAAKPDAESPAEE